MFLLKTLLAAAPLFPLYTVARGVQSPLPKAGQYDTGVSRIDASSARHHDDFYDFVTRPDIDAPRWDIVTYDEDSLSPGYWFVATYEFIEQEEYDNRSWYGPYIYDQAGELVWSGAPFFEGYNVIDFKVSPVNGVDMLTGIYSSKSYEVVLDNSYALHKIVPVEDGSFTNIHAFTTVNHGTKSLAMTQVVSPATRQDLDALECGLEEAFILYQGFEERDTTTWELTFTWYAHGHIFLNESLTDVQCSDMMDYLHANSIEKFPDDDYLLSGRFTDTLYKISHVDGSIVWRFGGKSSDFVHPNLHFLGQHDAQVHSQNDSTIILSILDNAYRPPRAYGNDHSRGMIIALRTDTMTAEAVQLYNHPYGRHADGRGNLQLLPNGNALLGWWSSPLLSEHASDGTLLLEASWKPPLKSYRCYKYPWIGRPTQPPDVYATSAKTTDGLAQTWTYVSWNGATEVDSWVAYEVSAQGQSVREIARTKRQGFETLLTYVAFAAYVQVVALDRDGNALGSSRVVETVRNHASSLFPLSTLHMWRMGYVWVCITAAFLLRWIRRTIKRRRRVKLTSLRGVVL